MPLKPVPVVIAALAALGALPVAASAQYGLQPNRFETAYPLSFYDPVPGIEVGNADFVGYGHSSYFFSFLVLRPAQVSVDYGYTGFLKNPGLVQLTLLDFTKTPVPYTGDFFLFPGIYVAEFDDQLSGRDVGIAVIAQGAYDGALASSPPPIITVPEPSALWLALVGLPLLGRIKKRSGRLPCPSLFRAK